MRWAGYFFSFQGRLSRRDYWLRSVIALLTFFLATVVILSLFAALLTATADCYKAVPANRAANDKAAIVVPLLFADLVFYLWALAAVAVRRCHDLGLPGRKMFDFRVSNFTLGYRRGTIGPNEFGPDPLEPKIP